MGFVKFCHHNLFESGLHYFVCKLDCERTKNLPKIGRTEFVILIRAKMPHYQFGLITHNYNSMFLEKSDQLRLIGLFTAMSDDMVPYEFSGYCGLTK
jgi:hypothetical protein